MPRRRFVMWRARAPADRKPGFARPTEKTLLTAPAPSYCLIQPSSVSGYIRWPISWRTMRIERRCSPTILRHRVQPDAARTAGAVTRSSHTALSFFVEVPHRTARGRRDPARSDIEVSPTTPITSCSRRTLAGARPRVGVVSR